MKKVFDFKLPIRLLSLLLGVIMLCTCLSTGIYSVTASNNTDGAFKLIGRSNYTEIDNDCYEVSLFPWESATTVRKVDLTKGFYFTVDG
ncbi:MAG: hypothetical protein IKK24_00655, partial [Clostridia bacterium]|nr:hypothetical protein [Clostridia bacterium]